MVTDSNPSASSLVNDTPGHEVLRDFSLVAVNSGGSIVLGGLLANKPLSEIVELYKSMSTRNRIFHRLNPVAHPIECTVHQLCGVLPQFSTERKLEALEPILGDVGRTPLAALGKSAGCPHILIPAFDYYTRERHSFEATSILL